MHTYTQSRAQRTPLELKSARYQGHRTAYKLHLQFILERLFTQLHSAKTTASAWGSKSSTLSELGGLVKIVLICARVATHATKWVAVMSKEQKIQFQLELGEWVEFNAPPDTIYVIPRQSSWRIPRLPNCDNQSNQTNYFIVRLKVDQRAGQLSLLHLGITKTEKNRIKT